MSIASLPSDLLVNGGMLKGGGADRSQSKFGLDILSCWSVINAHPTPDGFSNEDIGTKILNTNQPTTAPIRHGEVFAGKHCVVFDGRLYTMPLTGGIYTQVGADAIFSPTASVMMAKAQGANETEKLYIACDDGISNPYSYDGTTLTEITAFNTQILGRTFPKPNRVYAGRNRLHYLFPQNSDYKNYILCPRLFNADDFTKQGSPPSLLSAFFTQVAPGDGEYIQSLGFLRKDNTPEQNEVLVANKQNFSYQSDDITVDELGVNLQAVFTRSGTQLGSVSSKSNINFYNSLLTLNKYGIGSFESATTSGGIIAGSFDFGKRVNPLIQEASNQAVLSKSFAIHCPKRQLVMWFVPTPEAATSEYGFNYPETPINRAICLRYGLMTRGGNVLDIWTWREGAGWAFSSAWEHEGEIYLGSYFGKIYKLFDGDDYEILPSGTAQPIQTTIESGDWIINLDDVSALFNITNLKAHFKVSNQFSVDFEIAENGNEFGAEYKSNQIGIGGANTGFYDDANTIYDTTDSYASQLTSFVEIRPASQGNRKPFANRVKATWLSKVQNAQGQYISNHGALIGYSGKFRTK